MPVLKNFTALLMLLLAVSFIGSSCTKKAVSQKGAKSDQFEEDLAAFRPQYKIEETDATPAQNNESGTAINKPTRDVTVKLDTILNSIAQTNKNIRYAQGYRIQIYSGNNREEANKARDRSYALFPDITPHFIYTQPTFRVKVGDFVNRLEAQSVYAGLIADFPNAMIIQDRVEIK